MLVLKKYRWPISGIALIVLAVLTVMLLRKEITLTINNTPWKLTTYSLTVRGALRTADVPLGEADTLSPPLGHWLRRGDEIGIQQASQIQIHVDGSAQTLLSSERIPVVILAEAGISLHPEDQILADGLPVTLDQQLPYAWTHSLQIRRATTIHLDDEGNNSAFSSTASTLGGALWEQNIDLFNGDQLSPSLDTPLTGSDITATLDRTQALTIRSLGKISHTRSIGPSVGQALAESGLPLQGSDYSLPPEHNPLPENGEILIVRLREDITLEQIPLAFESIQQGLPELEIDNTQVVQAGEYGLTAQRVRVVYEAHPDAEGWVEIERQIEDEWVARQPVPRIVGYGTNVVVRTTNTADGPIEYWRAVQAYATSYSPCRLGVPDYCNTTTASGKQLQKGMIGVIRSWFNMMRGQAVYIPGYGFATIEDIGAGVSGQHWVDLGYTDEDWVSWHSTVTVYFLTPVPANIMWILE